MALPTRLRFPSRRAVAATIRSGRKFLTPFGRAILQPAQAEGSGRILFIVPSSVSKKSTKRNRIRRQLEAWAAERAGPLLAHYDVVVFVGAGVANMDHRAIRGRAESLLRLARHHQE